MSDNRLPSELENRIKEVQKDNSCPSCEENEASRDDIEASVVMINPDENTLDRG